VLIDLAVGHVIKCTWRRHFRLPPFAKNAKGRGTHCVGNARKIKGLGRPPSDSDESLYFNCRMRSCRNCRSGSCWVSAGAFSWEARASAVLPGLRYILLTVWQAHPPRQHSSNKLASARESLCRGLGSSRFTERFHRNALVPHFQHSKVFCTTRQLEHYAVTRFRLHQCAPQR
jgi:hypothetical protein